MSKWTSLSLFLPLLALGCGGGQTDTTTTPPPDDQTVETTVERTGLGIPNERTPEPGLVTGGLPDEAALREARAQGYQTVISLLPAGEEGAGDEEELVSSLGMRFVSIPIAGPDDLTEDNARLLAETLAAEGVRPAILHCASGNRAGALYALASFYEGTSMEEALTRGQDAGLTRLLDATRQHMETFCAEHADAPQCAAQPASE